MKKANQQSKIDEEFKKKWLNENAGQATLLSNQIISCRPDGGFFIKVENIEIFKNIFPEEYEKITEAYMSAIIKMKKHYYNEKQINVKFLKQIK